MVTPTKILDQMPLQYVQNFNLEHRSHIEHLNMTTDNIHWRLHLFGWLSFGTLTTVIILLMVAVTIWIMISFLPSKSTPRRRSSAVIINAENHTGLKQDDNIDHIIRPPRFIPQQPKFVKAEDDFPLEGESLGNH